MTQNIQHYLNSQSVSQKLSDLAKKHELDSQQTSTFYQIINLFSKGEIAESQLAIKLEEDLDIDFNTAMKLMMDVRRNVLAPILKQIEGILATVPPEERQKYMPDKLVEQGLKEAKFKPRNHNIQNRIEKAVLSWFKDVRDDTELKEALLREEKIGGAQMPEQAINNLLAFLKVKMTEIKNENIDIVQIIDDYEKMLSDDGIPLASQAKEVQESEIDVAAILPKAIEEKESITGEEITIEQLLETRGVTEDKLAKKEDLVKKIAAENDSPLVKQITAHEQVIEKTKDLAPPSPAIRAQSDSFEDYNFQEKQDTDKSTIKDPIEQMFEEYDFKEMPQSLSKPEPEERDKSLTAPSGPPQKQAIPRPKFAEPVMEKQPLIKKAADTSGQRPVVEDVKFSTKLYGPIEELAALSIDDFRRLSKDPLEAADRIIGKLDLLEDESIVQKTAGINALKSSPLYKLYADIMNNAMKEGKSIEESIKETFEGKITIEEYKAVTELNKSIKY